MTMNSRPESSFSIGAYFLGAVGAIVIVAGLVWVLLYNTRPAPLNEARIAERIKNLHEINATASDALNHYGWQDQTKGLIRMPISNAMEMVVREWRNPAAGRSNLLARVEKANPPPPPPAPKEPEKPTIFE
jgi:hypothetical protein